MYGRESAGGERLGAMIPGNPSDMLKPPQPANHPPMAREVEDQFEATKILLRELEGLEKRLMPVLRAPGPSGTSENKEPGEMPELLAAMHENTRAVYIACARLRDILERLVI